MVNRWNIVAALAVFVFALAMFNAWSWLAPFESKGEAREGLVVKSMIQQNNFVLPVVSGTVPSKPPMFHWGALGAIAVFGYHEGSIRFPSALAGALALALFFLFSRRTLAMQEALLSVLVVMTSFEWFRSATTARVDMVFSACLVLSFVFGFSLAKELVGDRKLLDFAVLVPGLAFGLADGLSFVAKGPAGSVIPWMAVAAFVLLLDRTRFTRLLLSGVLFVLPTVMIAGVWIYLAYNAGGEEFLRVQFFRENIARLSAVEGVTVGHRKPFFYSFIDLFLAFLPWSLFLPFIGARLRKEGRILFQKHEELFSLIWVLLFLVLITISVSERTVYFLPALPALGFLLLKLGLDNSDSRARKVSSFLALFSSLVGVTLLLVIFQSQLNLLPNFFSNHKSFELVYLVLNKLGNIELTCLVLLAAIMFLLRSRTTSGGMMSSQIFLSTGLLLLFQGVGYSLQVASLKANTARYFMNEVQRTLPSDARLAYWGPSTYQAQFYSDRPIDFTESTKDLGDGRTRFVLVREKDLEGFLGYFPQSVPKLRSYGFAADGKDQLLLLDLQPNWELPLILI